MKRRQTLLSAISVYKDLTMLCRVDVILRKIDTLQIIFVLLNHKLFSSDRESELESYCFIYLKNINHLLHLILE